MSMMNDIGTGAYTADGVSPGRVLPLGVNPRTITGALALVTASACGWQPSFEEVDLAEPAPLGGLGKLGTKRRIHVDWDDGGYPLDWQPQAIDEAWGQRRGRDGR